MVCVVIANCEVSCDVECVRKFANDAKLCQKLKFFTDEVVAKHILESDNPSYNAARLWTRKECIYKMFNVRNIYPHALIYNTKNEIVVNDMIIRTIKLKDLVLSFMFLDSYADVTIYELAEGELNEKV